MSSDFDPTAVNLTTADPRDIICFLNAGENEYDGRLGARISAIFVVLLSSLFFTLFPVVAARVKWFKINIYVYLFARYFGAGVIIATAFIQYVQLILPYPSMLTPTAFSTLPTKRSDRLRVLV